MTYITVSRIEERDKKGEKTVIPAGKELDLTPAQAKKYGAAVEKIEEAEPETVEDDETGGDGAGEGGNA
jgi:hypothetical protein